MPTTKIPQPMPFPLIPLWPLITSLLCLLYSVAHLQSLPLDTLRKDLPPLLEGLPTDDNISKQ